MALPHQALQQLLDKINSDVPAATVHGLWCGRLAAGDTPEAPEWWPYTLQVLAAEDEIEARMIAAFKAVAKFADQHLQRDDFQFEPWLPADDTTCWQRVQALSEWCQGFTEGLTSVLRERLASAPAEVKEMLKDLLDIGEVDVTVSGSEEDEKQLLELVEFVKVATLNIWHEYAAKGQPAGAAKESGPTLH